MSPPPIIVATEDRDRLLDLVARARANQVAEQLEAELERAQVIPLSQVPEDVVVMNSALEYEVVATHQVVAVDVGDRDLEPLVGRYLAERLGQPCRVEPAGVADDPDTALLGET